MLHNSEGTYIEGHHSLPLRYFTRIRSSQHDVLISCDRDVMDVVTSKLQRDEYLAPRECIKYAFSNLPSHSQLTQFFINDYGYNGFLFVGLHELPMDFLVGVMRIMMGRTPLRQCKGCYSKAKAENAWQGLNAAALAKGRDRDPFEHDRRFYHEHGSDEERQACKGERRKVRESRKKENSEPKTDLGNDTDSDHTDSENENEN